MNLLVVCNKEYPTYEQTTELGGKDEVDTENCGMNTNQKTVDNFFLRGAESQSIVLEIIYIDIQHNKLINLKTGVC